MARTPNILILMADQLAAAALPVYGNRTAHTPHLDGLAERAVVFRSAYCNSPLCAPSRYAFMSGRLPSAVGAYDNAAEFAAQVPTFAHYLRLGGYHTILAGKMHFCGADQLHGFEQRLTTDIYPADFGWTPDWLRFAERPSWYHSMDSVTQAGPCARTNQIDFDDEVVFRARRELFNLARGNDRRPFCMVVSFTHPHDPFAITHEYWNRYRDADIDMPRVELATADLDPHSLRLRHVCGMDATQITADQVRAARRAYYGAISYLDDQVGALLATLADTQFADDTVIVVLADHGEMLGERGLWFKMSFFEPACRVPLLFHAPRLFRARAVAQSVSLIDLLPTLLELAGDGATPRLATELEGRSLMPHLQGSGGHDEVLGEYLAEGAIAPIVMIRSGRHKFIHSPADPDQLYDLAEDPDELRNLAAGRGLAASDAHAQALRARVGRTWALATLHEQVLASQRRRRLVDAALRLGRQTAWDYQPVSDASRQYVRNNETLEELEASARFP
ncbi:MAG: choline-sulfatase, partial [Gammaproteobacteria bacterium]|nr:choline-sulfatase [Gammaproteobacteria bacterium]